MNEPSQPSTPPPVAQTPSEGEPKPSGFKVLWKEWILPLGLLALLITSFRSVVIDWNDVPSGSMIPTIVVGDRVLVQKLAYDLRVPYTRLRLARWGDPQRGDIVVFFSPEGERRLIKRVVGVPGDRVLLNNNRLTINGEPIQYGPLDSEQVAETTTEDWATGLFAWEHLGDIVHPIRVERAGPSGVATWGPGVVPEGQYLCMGDNRDRSRDSRFFGFVDRDRIVGKGTRVIFSAYTGRDGKKHFGRFFRPFPTKKALAEP